MDKLNLHEGLRIYIPGLLFCIILFALFTGSISNIGDVAVPAIFVGFAINSFLHIFQRKIFSNILINHQINFNNENEIFHVHQKNILSSKFDILYLNVSNPFTIIEVSDHKAWDFIDYGFFAKSYDSGDTSIFRLPKSYGVMCCNMYVVCLLTIFIFFITLPFINISLTKFHITSLITTLIFACLFNISAKLFLRDSLKKQLYYWASLSSSDMDKIVHLIKIQKSLS